MLAPIFFFAHQLNISLFALTASKAERIDFVHILPVRSLYHVAERRPIAQAQVRK